MPKNENVDWNFSGNIFNIQRYSLHDGPGIRTILFLKGCGLRCKWCGNPESQQAQPQVMFIKSRCINCRACERVCPVNAIVFEENRRIDASKCIHCGACAKACAAGALEMTGRKITVRGAFDEIKKDEIYYSYSGGGVTLSGGEPILQPDFAREVLKACRLSGWNTAIETGLFVGRDAIAKVLPYTDVFLADFKLFDSGSHRIYTGQANEKIKDNFKYISDNGGNIIMRIPLITTINDARGNLTKTAEFAKELGTVEEVDLLPYHRLGVNKYERLGRAYQVPEDIKRPDAEDINESAEVFRKYGFRVKIGG